MGVLTRRTALLGTAAALAATQARAAPTAAAARGPRKRLFVDTFESLASFDLAYGGPAGDPLAAQLATILGQSGPFDVVDRSDLGSLQTEQQLGAAHGSVAAIAQQDALILGAQIIVKGYITTFETAKTNGLSIGVAGANLGGALGGQTSKGILGMDIRVTDVATAVVLGSTHLQQSVNSSNVTGAVTGQGATLGQQNASNTVLGQATRAAFGQAAAFVNKTLASVAWTGLVADVDGNQVYVNVGQVGNVQVGDLFDISRVAKRITDPSSGELLGVTETPVGRIRIASVQPKFSVGAPLSGDIAAMKGDIARYVSG